MVPGRNRGGGLVVELPGPVLVLENDLKPEPGESTQGEAWLMVMDGLQVVWVELVLSAAVWWRVDGVNSVVGLLAELLVLWKGREPGLRGMVPTNPV